MTILPCHRKSVQIRENRVNTEADELLQLRRTLRISGPGRSAFHLSKLASPAYDHPQTLFHWPVSAAGKLLGSFLKSSQSAHCFDVSKRCPS